MMMTTAGNACDFAQATTTCLDKPKREPWETDEEYEKRLPKMIELPKPRKEKKDWQSKWPG